MELRGGGLHHKVTEDIITPFFIQNWASFSHTVMKAVYWKHSTKNTPSPMVKPGGGNILLWGCSYRSRAREDRGANGWRSKTEKSVRNTCCSLRDKCDWAEKQAGTRCQRSTKTSVTSQRAESESWPRASTQLLARPGHFCALAVWTSFFYCCRKEWQKWLSRHTHIPCMWFWCNVMATKYGFTILQQQTSTDYFLLYLYFSMPTCK